MILSLRVVEFVSIFLPFFLSFGELLPEVGFIELATRSIGQRVVR
jgi:hypothetical protein